MDGCGRERKRECSGPAFVCEPPLPWRSTCACPCDSRTARHGGHRTRFVPKEGPRHCYATLPLNCSIIQLTWRPRGARVGAVDSAGRAGRAWAGRWMVMSVKEREREIWGPAFYLFTSPSMALHVRLPCDSRTARHGGHRTRFVPKEGPRHCYATLPRNIFLQLTWRPRGARVGAVASAGRAGRAWAGRWYGFERESRGSAFFFCSPLLPWRFSHDVNVVRTCNSGRAWGSVFL